MQNDRNKSKNMQNKRRREKEIKRKEIKEKGKKEKGKGRGGGVGGGVDGGPYGRLKCPLVPDTCRLGGVAISGQKCKIKGCKPRA